MEPFDFPSGLSAIRRAKLDVEAAVFREVEQLAVELVLAFVVGVSFGDDGLRIVAQYMEASRRQTNETRAPSMRSMFPYVRCQ